MSVVIEPLPSPVSISARGQPDDPMSRVAPRHPGAIRTPRPAHPHWFSTLDARDLDCLLQVIEADLVPCLLKAYSPARQSPLGSADSSG